MRSRSLLALVSLPLFVTVACTSDLPAPNDFNQATDSVGETDGALALSCEGWVGAVGAEADFTVMVEGGAMPFTFEAMNLPAGLSIDSSTGRITGVFEAVDPSASFAVDVTDGDGETATTQCQIQVNPSLSAPIDVADVPFCLRNGTLLDLVVPGTGDGTPIVCEAPGGTGNGRVPEGISIDPDTCEVEGAVTEDRRGTWAFMVRGTQSGANVWVPYCVTRADGGGSYDIDVDHSGLGTDIDSTLLPISRVFDPAAPLSVGEPMDPFFQVIDEASCGANSCFFGFVFSINASPFDADSFGVVNDQLLQDPTTSNPIGFSHGWATLTGDPVDERFADRPWVLNVDLDYCLDGTESECQGLMNIRENGDLRFQMSVIMVPEQN